MFELLNFYIKHVFISVTILPKMVLHLTKVLLHALPRSKQTRDLTNPSAEMDEDICVHRDYPPRRTSKDHARRVSKRGRVCKLWRGVAWRREKGERKERDIEIY